MDLWTLAAVQKFKILNIQDGGRCTATIVKIEKSAISDHISIFYNRLADFDEVLQSDAYASGPLWFFKNFGTVH